MRITSSSLQRLQSCNGVEHNKAIIKLIDKMNSSKFITSMELQRSNRYNLVNKFE